jgi:hypothetical protein
MKKLLVALLALTACGPAVNGGYRGLPVATLGGMLSLKDGLTISHEVRLAIAWYPDLSAESPTPPRAIVTEEISYTGAFPQNYSFRLYGPPTPEAIAQIFGQGGTPEGRAAVGQLVAYEDLDDDGQLSLDAKGRATDRILGSTAGAGAFDFYTTATRYLVLWTQDGADLGLPGVQPGYNLLRYENPLSPPEALPLTSSIPIALTAEPRLALIACPEAYLAPQPEMACGVRVWDTPEVNGTITLQDNGGIDAFVLVSAGGQTSSTATVRVNGTVVPHDSSNLAHSLVEPTPSVLHTGVNVIVIEQPGYEPLTLQAVVPARFDVTSPAADATLVAGSTITARWTPATGATRYAASLFVDGAMPSNTEFVTGTSAPVKVPDGAGTGQLSIVAYDRFALSRAAIFGLSVRNMNVTVSR